MTWYARDDDPQRLKAEISDLQYQLDSEREARQREQHERRREEEARRAERRAAFEERLSHADNFPDAFAKSIARAEREAVGEQEFPEDERYFTGFAARLKRAQALYNETMPAVEEQIAALRREALVQIAGRVEAEFPDTASDVIDALRDDDPDGLCNW